MMRYNLTMSHILIHLIYKSKHMQVPTNIQYIGLAEYYSVKISQKMTSESSCNLLQSEL